MGQEEALGPCPGLDAARSASPHSQDGETLALTCCAGHFSEGIVEFAAGRRKLSAEAEEFLKRLLMIADTIYAENIDDLVDAVREAIGRLAEFYPEGAPLGPAAETIAAFTVPELTAEIEEAIIATRGLAFLNAYRTSERFIPGAGSASLPDDIDPRYRDAAEWMVNRRIATRDDVRAMSRATSLLDSGRPPEEFERAIRQEVLALAKSPSLEMTKRFQTALGEAVGLGETVGKFVTQMDAAVADGMLPGGMDSYLRTVYRTETANAYGAQRRDAFNDPRIDPYVWGRQFFNAKLPTSRESHVAIDGLMLRRGSAADMAAGSPPFSYNCTCVEIALMSADPSTDRQYEEPPDALQLVQAIERF
jgi:hypothetical protein